MSQMLDIGIVGHLTIDTIHVHGEAKPKTRLGGSSAYTSLAAKALGATIAIASKVGADFPQQYMQLLEQSTINVAAVKQSPKHQTTRFTLKYDAHGRRRLWLKTQAPPILPEDIPEWFKAKTIHVGSIAGETPKPTITELRSRADMLSLDAQGLLRAFSKTGKITLKAAENLLGNMRDIDVYKSTATEAKILTHAKNTYTAVKKISDYGPEIVIATQGGKGALFMHHARLCHVPAYPAKPVDPTGAGDMLIGAFLAEYTKEKDTLWCMSVGAAAASLKIEANGLVMPSQRAVYERATEIHKRLKPCRL